MTSSSSGYLYTVTGKYHFVEEALQSVRSLRRHHSEANATLVTDLRVDGAVPEVHDAFDTVVRPEESSRDDDDGPGEWKDNLLFKIRHVYESSPYQRTFFIDTDTRFLRGCHDLFNLLEYFDLCLSHAPADLETVQGYDSDLTGYTPYNTGVMLFRKNERTGALFRLWYHIYKNEFDRYLYGQPAFMAALLECSHHLDTYTLQSVMNFRTPYNERLTGPVRIMHGRPPNVDQVVEEVNRTHENRVWLADMGVVVPLRMSLREQLRLVRKLAVHFLFTCKDAVVRRCSQVLSRE